MADYFTFYGLGEICICASYFLDQTTLSFIVITVLYSCNKFTFVLLYLFFTSNHITVNEAMPVQRKHHNSLSYNDCYDPIPASTANTSLCLSWNALSRVNPSARAFTLFVNATARPSTLRLP